MKMLLDLLGNTLEFLLITVGLKMIVGHWLAERIESYGKTMFTKTERNAAIWAHYQHRAVGAGHNGTSVIGCVDDKCSQF